MTNTNSRPTLLFSLRGHKVACTSLCLSEISEIYFLFSGDEFGNVLVWNLNTRRVVEVIEKVESTLTKEFGLEKKDSNGQSIRPQEGLACPTASAQSREPQETAWKPHDSSILHLMYHAKRSLLFTQARDNQLKIWKLSHSGDHQMMQAKLIRQLPIDSLHFCKFDLLNDSVAFCLAAPKVAILDVSDLVKETEKTKSVDPIFIDLESGKGACTCLAWKSAEELVVGYEDGSVVGLSASSFSTRSLYWKHDEVVLNLKAYPDDILLSSGADDQVLSSNNDKLTVKLPHPGVSAMAWDAPSNTMVLCSWKGSILFYNGSLPVGDFVEHRKPLRSCCIGHVSINRKSIQLVLVSSEDGRISAWGIDW